MSSHSRRQDRGVAVDLPDITADGDADSARSVAVEEDLLAEADRLPRPVGFGEEASTSSTDFEEVDAYEVPAGHLAELREASLSIQANGEAFVAVNGVQYGPFTGAVDITVPLDPAILPEGYDVVVKHRSTDGNETTTKAQLSAAEV